MAAAKKVILPPVQVTVESDPPTTLAAQNLLSEIVNSLVSDQGRKPEDVTIAHTRETVSFLWVV